MNRICRRCVFHSISAKGIDRCYRDGYINNVTGRSISDKVCYTERALESACGPEGKYFKPKFLYRLFNFDE